MVLLFSCSLCHQCRFQIPTNRRNPTENILTSINCQQRNDLAASRSDTRHAKIFQINFRLLLNSLMLLFHFIF
jgi:hypothetical protein